MKIWIVEPDLGKFDDFMFTNKNDEFFRNFNTKIDSLIKYKEEFINQEIELIDKGKKTDFARFWNSISSPLLSQNSVTVLKDIISSDVELIPVKHKDHTYYVLHVITALDVVDYDRATFRKLETGLVVSLEKYAFKKDVIGNHNVFWIYLNNRLQTTKIYVTNKFKETVEQSNLKGFQFTEVWNSED